MQLPAAASGGSSSSQTPLPSGLPLVSPHPLRCFSSPITTRFAGFAIGSGMTRQKGTKERPGRDSEFPSPLWKPLSLKRPKGETSRFPPCGIPFPEKSGVLPYLQSCALIPARRGRCPHRPVLCLSVLSVGTINAPTGKVEIRGTGANRRA